jgi:hypothetical protein
VIVKERRDGGVGDQDDVAAVTAVTAVRTTEWFEFLAVDRDAAFATVSGRQV